MCGIFGIAGKQSDGWRDVMARAENSLAHRGPDDHGTIVIDSGDPELGQVGLVHTRLSILDLSQLGHQPMQDPATGNWIVYNGEIYNFRELREQLEAGGSRFHSHSDTEVILSAYREWEVESFSKLRGMFALALWDAKKKSLLLARDPMGIKPLYYARSGGNFLFASEIRPLLGTGLIPRKLDPTGVLSYLEFGSVCEPWTVIEGVSALPAGTVLILEKGSVRFQEYWNPARAANSQLPVTSAAESVSSALQQAVLSHLVSDVPVGVFLSGGIDSSSLVALMSRQGVRANTFSLVFREEEFNEAQYSREVARVFNTEHQEIPVSESDALALLPEALRSMDQPTIDGINTYLVSSNTRAAGIKVALSGLGADEMFAGYSNFRRVPEMERLQRQLSRLPITLRGLIAASTAAFASRNDRLRKTAELISDSRRVHPYFLARMLFARSERRSLFAGQMLEHAEEQVDGALKKSVVEYTASDPINRVSYLETQWYLRNTLLRDSDFMSMAHGLELRVPFLDRHLVEVCFATPGKAKLDGRVPKKLLLGSLQVELPASIVNRPKRGFTLPFERWLRGDMRSAAETTLGTGNFGLLKADAVRQVWQRFLGGHTSWTRPWSLFVLTRWCELNL
jgi:asparagine synthase (glutamine-hydrolysing)